MRKRKETDKNKNCESLEAVTHTHTQGIYKKETKRQPN